MCKRETSRDPSREKGAEERVLLYIEDESLGGISKMDESMGHRKSTSRSNESGPKEMEWPRDGRRGVGRKQERKPR